MDLITSTYVKDMNAIKICSNELQQQGSELAKQILVINQQQDKNNTVLINNGKSQLDVLNKIMENLKINDLPAAGQVRMQVHTLNKAIDPNLMHSSDIDASKVTPPLGINPAMPRDADVFEGSVHSNPPDVDVDPEILELAD